MNIFKFFDKKTYSTKSRISSLRNSTGNDFKKKSVILDMVVDGQSGDRVVDGRFKRRLLQSIKKQADKGKSFDWIVILGGTNDCFNGYKSNNIFAVLKDLYLNSENSGANVSALTISNFNNDKFEKT
ncbi:SGNH hydrolase [Rhizophagus clarus]|uniref:SGNH hydrolase n=1 Tax=Rhizophagus clarus TaxID=94130 RepID=A0A8H3KRY8_9GLOM|nr:SGNH hydrolase [Rhizophagus clarus]